MPELVSGGPTIPVQLMNRLDSGRAVFFCGAGVSVGAGSGLPTFVELVQHVYDKNGMKPDDVEKQALHLDVPDKTKRRPQLDKALDLLERSDRLGAAVLRRTVIERLSKAPTGTLAVHKALIALSRHGKRRPTGHDELRHAVRRSRSGPEAHRCRSEAAGPETAQLEESRAPARTHRRG